MTMFRFTVLVAILLGLAVGTSRAIAVGADDQFIAIYNLIQQADAQSESGRGVDAYEGYAKAQTDLRNLQRQYPSWNERVINYRLRYVGERLAALKGSGAATAKTDPAAPADKAAATTPPALAPTGEVVTQFNALSEQIQRLNAEKGLLEAKLREALTAQPAPVDPRQLQEAVERISTLQQTNKVLLSRLEEQERERKNLVEKVVADEAQKALNDANRQLLEQRLAASKLEKAKTEVEEQLKQLQDGSLKKLEGENSALKKQVTELRADTEKGRQVAELAGKLGRLEAQVDDLKKQNDALAADKAALEKHLSDINVRKAEESIVKIARLETDLALAQADAARNSQKAEALAVALGQAKTNYVQLEDQNRSLGERVMSLTRENKDAAGTVRKLQSALAEEQAGRAELENRLKQAEQQLADLNTTGKPREAVPPRTEGGPAAAVLPRPAPISPEVAERAAVLEAEAKSLRAALRESREREVEVKNLLAEEQNLRTQLEREKADLERRVSTLTAAVASTTNAPSMAAVRVAAPSAAPAAAALPSPSAQVTAALEKRVRELERQREQLQRRLIAAGIQLDATATARRLRITTPREHAAESRMRQP